MANDFNDFSFEVTAKDNASKVLNNIANSLEKIKGISSTKQTEPVKKVSNNTINSYAKLGIKLSAIGLSARQLGRTFTSLIKESGSYIENLNLFAVTFGDTYKETLEWSLDLAKNFGLASNEVIKFTGLFKQLSTAIGVASDTGDMMSEVLTQLGYDFASFYNIGITSAMEKLQAGIYSGQTKPLNFSGTSEQLLVKKLCEPRNLGCEQYKIAC